MGGRTAAEQAEEIIEKPTKTVGMTTLEGLPLPVGVVIFCVRLYGISYASHS